MREGIKQAHRRDPRKGREEMSEYIFILNTEYYELKKYKVLYEALQRQLERVDEAYRDAIQNMMPKKKEENTTP